VPEPAAQARSRPALIRRFNGVEIALHWVYAVLFFVLLLTGLGLYLGPGQNPVLSHRSLVREVHLDAALALVALPVIVASARVGTLSRLWRDVESFDADDGRWLRRAVLPRILRRRPLPPQGRFNAGQKLNTIAVCAATVGFVVTGTLMWQGAHLPTSLAEAADTWHLLLMVAMAPLVAGHLVLALLLPSTRPALRGVFFGTVRLDFATRRHAKWVGSAPPAATVDSTPAP
jgi:cytochrome b subunit of formate dehydrogenase